MLIGSNDILILRKVANGDEPAFKQLFLEWQPFLSSHIYRITESRELTEEIVQDIFLKIWLTRETLDKIENFKAYLVVVSRNQALNVLRQRAAMARQHKVWEMEQKPDGPPDPHSIYYTLIDEAINNLSPRQKEVYLLHRHERLKYSEVANRLKLSRETVKTHLQQAVAGITKYIKERINS